MKTPFQKISIIGLGLIGGSLAAAIKRKGVQADITGIDNEQAISTGLQMGVVDYGYEPAQLALGLAGADLVILATPISGIKNYLTRIGPFLKAGALVTDVGSTKVEISGQAARCLPDKVDFLGGHPMTGAERGGVSNADPFLFENAIYVITEEQPVDAAGKAALVSLVELIGARVVFLSAAQHDQIAGVVSHLPHILAVALMNFAAHRNEQDPAYLKLAAGGFRDMTRVASSPFAIWEDILATNQQNIRALLDEFVESIRQMRGLVGEDGISELFDAAARNRVGIPKDTRGFIRPHFDAYVVVEDKPGVIASISTSLASAAINIKDIEVVKVREGDAGTIRLAFESEADRARAMKLLQTAGFRTNKRE